jgi:hypothetical protein
MARTNLVSLFLALKPPPHSRLYALHHNALPLRKSKKGSLHTALNLFITGASFWYETVSSPSSPPNLQPASIRPQPSNTTVDRRQDARRRLEGYKETGSKERLSQIEEEGKTRCTSYP